MVSKCDVHPQSYSFTILRRVSHSFRPQITLDSLWVAIEVIILRMYSIHLKMLGTVVQGIAKVRGVSRTFSFNQIIVSVNKSVQ